MTTKQLKAIRDLNSQGVHDREIARRLGLHWVCVGQARRNMGLPLHDGRMQNSENNRQRVIELAQKGLTDVQICVRVGISERYVAQLRQEAGILRVSGSKPPLISKEQLTRMVKAGMRSNEIARETGIKVRTIAEYRRRWGLNLAPISRPQKEVLAEMMNANMTQREMANKLGCDVSSIKNWQKQYGLKQPRARLEQAWDMWRKTNTITPRRIDYVKRAI